MYKLRSYQHEAVQATLKHFRKEKSPAVVVLPTGAGKSLVIAELARLAKGRVLVMAHVRELVEQNYLKFKSFELEAGIFSAGLNKKQTTQKVIFASIQSIARAEEEIFKGFSLVVIDECHRVNTEGETQYFQVLEKLQKHNPDLCVLGLTATPYRLGLGYIYNYNLSQKRQVSSELRFFKKCIYELSIRYLIKNNFLTPPVKIDSPVACYDFSSLKLHGTSYISAQIEALLKDQKRITPIIIQNIIDISKERQGVMIFTSSVNHAVEIMRSLPPYVAALVTGETESSDREEIIHAFKERKLKYLVNVSVLTTGFDAPHVDVIAILRPTESVSLYQQIVGRGLRLSPNKKDCLVLDYTGQNHDLFAPEIDEDKPNTSSVKVEVLCPECGVTNHFWGLKDAEGNIKEHFGRKCLGILEDPVSGEIEKCNFRFRFKRCDQCGAENDIAARVCSSCRHMLVDNDKKLKEAMALKDAHVLQVDSVTYTKGYDKSGNERLEVRYYDFDAKHLTEYFYLRNATDAKAFYFNFIRMHSRLPEKKLFIKTVDEAIAQRESFRNPSFVIARQQKKFWVVREKIFDRL